MTYKFGKSYSRIKSNLKNINVYSASSDLLRRTIVYKYIKEKIT